MSQVAERLVAKTGSVIAKRDIAAAMELERDDDEMDKLHRALFTELLDRDSPYAVEQAVDVTQIGRYYERFADHAVEIGRRVIFLVTGELPPDTDTES